VTSAITSCHKIYLTLPCTRAGDVFPAADMGRGSFTTTRDSMSLSPLRCDCACGLPNGNERLLPSANRLVRKRSNKVTTLEDKVQL
jgi:hypothetical protein